MKACIFDLDGTLTNTLNAIAHFGNTALEYYGFSGYPTEKYKKFVGDGRNKLIKRMLDGQGELTDDNYEKVGAVYDKNYESEPLYDTDAYDGIRELLKEIRKMGIKTAVCSNKPDNVVQDVVKKIFGDNYFDCVHGIVDGMPTKPNAGCALRVADELSVKADECLFIGDTNVDIFTAKNAKMKSVGVLWGFRDYNELKEAGADYIVEKPLEILQILKK